MFSIPPVFSIPGKEETGTLVYLGGETAQIYQAPTTPPQFRGGVGVRAMLRSLNDSILCLTKKTGSWRE
jgi:hypothetical protein